MSRSLVANRQYGLMNDSTEEFAATYGGKLEAGPRPQGGWRVHLRRDPNAEGALQ